MRREVDMKEVSDGKRYHSGDMAKIGCNDCVGCSDCCHGMGESIVLDPYDMYQLTKNLSKTPEELLQRELAFGMVDGVILPHLSLQGKEEGCLFLNEQGRCSIHSFRPGFCRLFPLGRIYENGTFSYFVQIHECDRVGKVKVKIAKWLGIPKIHQYEEFISDWHYFLKEIQMKADAIPQEQLKEINMQVLHEFLLKPYDSEKDFYEQYASRREECGEIWKNAF